MGVSEGSLAPLHKDQSAWCVARDTRQFSLAGVQPKTAFLFDGVRWGVPSGRKAKTHILKPPVEAFDGHAENGPLCLALARKLGFPREPDRSTLLAALDTVRWSHSSKSGNRLCVRI